MNNNHQHFSDAAPDEIGAGTAGTPPRSARGIPATLRRLSLVHRPAYVALTALCATTLLAACTLPFGAQQTDQPQRRRQGNRQQIAATPETNAQGTVVAGDSAAPADAPVRQRPTALPTRAVVVEDTVTVDGALTAAIPVISIGFEASGRVTKVNIVGGQRVKTGEVLAEIDDANLRESLLIAKEKLALQRANIANSLLPSTETDVRGAEASLSSAYAAYNELKKGPKSTSVEQALRSLNQQKNSLYNTQLSRDLVCRIQPGVSTDDYVAAVKARDPDCREIDLNVQAAELRLRNAEQQYRDAQKPATSADLTRAWSNIVQAQSTLARLKRGVSAEQKAIYELQIKQSELAVARAERALKNTQLISPCECVVQGSTLSIGALSAGSAVTLLDTRQLHFRTTNLSERDVVTLAQGQPVNVRFKAFDQIFAGKVMAILPQSSGQLNGAALYTALISLETPDQTLLPGMTGQAEISLK
jgi:HlyD family secretion protein